MKPNILFIVIDSLRADKCHGNEKTSVTPNIDRLIEGGTYFAQNITSAPSTIPSMSSILTGLYPFECVTKQEKFFAINDSVDNYIKKLEENNYNCYCTIPKIISYLGFEKIFHENLEVYDRTSTLYNGLGEKIVDRISSYAMNEPWFYYLHLYDLVWISSNAHFNPGDGPDEIRNNKFGMNQYERIFSVMDIWFGRIFQNLDLKNTLIVMTGDHGTDIGAYTPTMEKENQKFQQLRANNIDDSFRIGQKIAKKLPRHLVPFRKKLSDKYTTKNEKDVKNKIQIEFEKIEKLGLSPYEERLMKYSVIPIQNLYDEKYHVPLIFSGYNVPSEVLISDQARSVDIFSTIMDIIGLNTINENKRGRSLLPFMQGKYFDELPVYIESAINAVKSLTDNTIGIRTSEFKYFRDKNNFTKNVHLYDLRKDRLEENNIANNKNDVVIKMEEILQDILKNGNMKQKKSYEEIDDNQSRIIESELKKLGYIN